MTTLRQLFDIAVARLEGGSPDRAKNLLLQIQAQTPDDPAVSYQLARICLVEHQYGEAAERLGKLSSAHPDQPHILMDLGRAYVGQGQYQEGIACLERAAILSPDRSDIRRHLSEALFAARRYDEAARQADSACALAPRDPLAHAARGNAYLEMRRVDEAVASYDRCLDLTPDNWKAHANRGMAFLLAGDLAQAKGALVFANALSPMAPQVVLPLASVLLDLGEYPDARALLNKLEPMMPQHPRVLTLIGLCSLAQGAPRDAATALVKALAVDGSDRSTPLRLVEAFVKDGRSGNALALLDRLIEEDAGAPLAAWVEKARLHLLEGAFEQGIDTIERLQSLVVSDLDAPLWDGSDLNGSSILLYAQFGLDELIVLSGLAPLVRQRGGRVIVESAAPARELIAGLSGIDASVPAGAPAPEVDARSPLERLPGLLDIKGRALLDKPAFAPDPALRQSWEQTLGTGKRRVGIMWRKETDKRPDIYRSIPLEKLAPLTQIDDIALFSLQTNVGLDELPRFDGQRKIRHLDALQNAHLDQRIACIAALDLFISPDTFTAQAAASAGLPVWILLGTAPAWHYGLSGETSVWHPSARLFRQTAIGEWEAVIAEVARALEARVTSAP